MADFKTTQVFANLLENEKFKNYYFRNFLDRFVEELCKNEEKKKPIDNLLEVLNYLVAIEEGKLSPFDVIDIANKINIEDGIAGFRKINVLPGNYANWNPTSPNKIYMAMYSLFDNYYNVWNIRNVFEREAAFHISFMRIHPLEDGNKRVAKLIMSANLLKQNIPPVLITENETELYYDFINNEDVLGFAKFLENKSLEELQLLMSNYFTSEEINNIKR